MSTNDKTEAQSAPAEPPKAEWSDPRVQAVYAILTSGEVPPAEQHWEGWAARRIVDALCGAPAEAQPAAERLMDCIRGAAAAQEELLSRIERPPIEAVPEAALLLVRLRGWRDDLQARADAAVRATDEAAEPQPVPAGEPEYCPHCGGSGEVMAPDSAGPDAFDVSETCPHCNGEQTLAAAYAGVLALFKTEQDKYLKACGDAWSRKHLPAGEALPEPVAWLRPSVGDLILARSKASLGAVDYSVPLYAAQVVAAAQPAKPLDDPRLQQLFGDAIEGALAFGAQGGNTPPAGHWLERFWRIGRETATQPQASAGAVPAGWQIERSTLPGSGQVPAIVIVQLGAQAAAVTALDDHLAGMLYRLADALLTASETSQPKTDGAAA